MVSRESEVASSSTAPLGRTPTRSGMTAGKPSAVEVDDGMQHGLAQIVDDLGAGALGGWVVPAYRPGSRRSCGLEMRLGSER